MQSCLCVFPPEHFKYLDVGRGHSGFVLGSPGSCAASKTGMSFDHLPPQHILYLSFCGSEDLPTRTLGRNNKSAAGGYKSEPKRGCILLRRNQRTLCLHLLAQLWRRVVCPMITATRSERADKSKHGGSDHRNMIFTSNRRLAAAIATALEDLFSVENEQYHQMSYHPYCG